MKALTTALLQRSHHDCPTSGTLMPRTHATSANEGFAMKLVSAAVEGHWGSDRTYLRQPNGKGYALQRSCCHLLDSAQYLTQLVSICWKTGKA